MADIKGTNVASKIVPYTTSDNYATHDEEYGRGGYRTVNTVAEMNAIPADRRKEGMLVYVKNDKYYRLNSSNTFEDAGIGSSGGGNIYIVDTDKLNFELISDGKDATDNELAEIGVILERWSSSVIPVYLPTTVDSNGYIGVLNINVVNGDNIVFTIPYNETINLYSLNLSITNWSVLDISAGGGGSGLDWDSAHNFSQNGYQKFNNGLMIQWGYNNGGTSGNGKTIYMPTSFINSTYNVQSAGILQNTSEKIVYSPSVYTKGTSYFTIYTRYIGQGSTNVETTGWNFEWLAIGRWK